MLCMIFAFGVGVLAEEPENGDNETAQENEKQLEPLVFTFVKFCDNDLAAGDVDESSA